MKPKPNGSLTTIGPKPNDAQDKMEAAKLVRNEGWQRTAKRGEKERKKKEEKREKKPLLIMVATSPPKSSFAAVSLHCQEWRLSPPLYKAVILDRESCSVVCKRG